MGNKDTVLDVIPVDIVINSMIIAASQNTKNDFKVYNCTSGSMNPITIEKFAEYGEPHLVYEGLRNNFVINTNYFLHITNRIFFNYLPYTIIDLGLLFTGSKPKYLMQSWKFYSGIDVLDYFVKNEWNFEVENFKKLIEISKDQEGNFNCDIKEVKWDQFIEKFVRGIDKYILKKE